MITDREWRPGDPLYDQDIFCTTRGFFTIKADVDGSCMPAQWPDPLPGLDLDDWDES